MVVRIKNIRKATNEEWDSIWKDCPHATYFHSREWAEVWSGYRGAQSIPEPRLVIFADGLRALLPLSFEKRGHGLWGGYISSPAGNFGGWISRDDLSLAHSQLLADVLIKKFRVVFWRINPYDKNCSGLDIKGLCPDVTHTIDLSVGFENINNNWDHAHLSSVRKAEKAGVVVRLAETLDDWREYYLVYQDSLRRWGDKATSNYGSGFFKILFDRRSPHIKLWLAIYEGKVISGSLCYHSREHIAYWHGATLEEYFSLRPANLLVFQMVKAACESGYRWFDLNPSGGHIGVKVFKERVGAVPLSAPFYHNRRTDPNLVFKHEQRGSLIFAAGTIDIEDVRIAEEQLRNRGNWYDRTVIADFEKEFGLWNGSKYAFSFMGGRVALSAIIYALGLQPGDEVLVPGYTCIVVPNSFIYAGIKLKYVDIEHDTYGVDIGDLKKKVTNQTKAILLQHLYGLVSRDYEAIVRYAKKRKIYVIEDCAHSTGAMFQGKRVGNMGDAAFYTSEHSKIFTTFNGGIAVTNDDQIASKIAEYQEAAPFPDKPRIRRLLKSFMYDYYVIKNKNGLLKAYWKNLYSHQYLESTTKDEIESRKPAHYGQRMPAALAIIGLNQLKKIDSYNDIRRANAVRWDKWCEASGYLKPVVIKDSKPVFLRYPVLVKPEMKKRHKWAKSLRVPIGVWFVSNAHPSALPIAGCPRADEAVASCINFPTLGRDI